MKQIFQSTTLLVLITIQFGCSTKNSSNDQKQTEKDQVVKSANGLYGFLCTAKPTDGDWYLTDENAPLLNGLGNLTYPVTTNSIEAQKYFDQEFILSYIFNEALEEITVWDITTSTDQIAIAINVLEGEIAAMNLDYDKAIQKLSKAMEIEDGLNYNEPPDWFFSVRHNLATVMIEAGSLEDSIEVLRKDLQNFPENGWALSELTRPYHDIEQELLWNEYKQRFFRAWEHADVALKHSKVL